jgi:glycosyltransferase involved in cell wall biosynthesis
MTSDGIAVVVIGRNEGERLVKCLRSIGSDVSCVVYVDSGSTDGSAEAAERLGAHVVALNMTQPFTAARARNAGLAIVKALKPNIKLIQFIDGDCELVDEWLNKAELFMSERNDVAVVCGRRRELYPSASVYNRLCDIEWDTPVGQASACGGDSLARAEAIVPVGGFCARLIAGEEPELCVRLRERGWKIWRLDVEMTRHDAAMSRFGQWWLRAVRTGYGITELCCLHWHSPAAIWKKELMRGIVWGGVLPALIVLGALVYPPTLIAVLIYPLQVCRIAINRGATALQSWSYAFFMTLAKFAEFQGVLRFCWSTLQHRTVALIEYK